jgi:hypothetical protein
MSQACGSSPLVEVLEMPCRSIINKHHQYGGAAAIIWQDVFRVLFDVFDALSVV